MMTRLPPFFDHYLALPMPVLLASLLAACNQTPEAQAAQPNGRVVKAVRQPQIERNEIGRAHV